MVRPGERTAASASCLLGCEGGDRSRQPWGRSPVASGTRGVIGDGGKAGHRASMRCKCQALEPSPVSTGSQAPASYIYYDRSQVARQDLGRAPGWRRFPGALAVTNGRHPGSGSTAGRTRAPRPSDRAFRFLCWEGSVSVARITDGRVVTILRPIAVCFRDAASQRARRTPEGSEWTATRGRGPQGGRAYRKAAHADSASSDPTWCFSSDLGAAYVRRGANDGDSHRL
jgi:hypothetical protein